MTAHRTNLAYGVFSRIMYMAGVPNKILYILIAHIVALGIYNHIAPIWFIAFHHFPIQDRQRNIETQAPTTWANEHHQDQKQAWGSKSIYANAFQILVSSSYPKYPNHVF